MRISILLIFMGAGLNILSGQTLKLVEKRPLPAVLSESSGLAIGADGNFWSHNDSGNQPQLFSFNRSGELLHTIQVSNARNIDWEEVVWKNDTLWVCDCGNNLNTRKDLRILVISAKNLQPGLNLRNADFINFEYAEQTQFPPPTSQANFDTEAMVLANDSIYLFTKNRTEPCDGLTYQYALPAKTGNWGRIGRIDSLQIGTTPFIDWITAASFHPHWGLALLSANKIHVIEGFKEYFRLGSGVKTYTLPKPETQKEGLIWLNNVQWILTDEDHPLIQNDKQLYHIGH